MNTTHYLNIFEHAADQLDKSSLQKKHMHATVGIVLESVFLKLYKTSWANPSPDPLTSPSRIFFSVWISDKTIREGKLMYNIHALKLRLLKGYTITSRQFAVDFRKAFTKFEKQWPNVSTDFGPLTLMQGWMPLNEVSLQKDILSLANKFLTIEYLVDELLQQWK